MLRPPQPSPQGASATFTYLHGCGNFIDDNLSMESLGPSIAMRIERSIPEDLQRRIHAWDVRMGEAFDYRQYGEGRPLEDWPETLLRQLTEEYDALLTELWDLGLPVTGHTWWAAEMNGPLDHG